MAEATIHRRTDAPGIALVVVGVIGIIAQLVALVVNLAGSTPGMVGAVDGLAEDLHPTVALATFIFSSVVAVAVGGFIIYGGLQLRAVRSYGLAMVAAILAMIPCISPCCILGIPVGVWALVVLNDPEVRAAFGK